MISETDGQQSPNNAANGRISLGAGCSVALEFFQQLLHWILYRLTALVLGCTYTAEELAGKEFWDLLSNAERQLAGKCIKRMVDNGLLPLVRVQGAHEYPYLYQPI